MRHIVKRNGRLVPFNRQKIAFAVYRAAVAVGGRDRTPAESIANDVVSILERGIAAKGSAGLLENCRLGTNDFAPTVEEVQDLVEKALIDRGHARTAKAYIIYRYEHALKRKGRRSLTYSLDDIPYKNLWETLVWTVDHKCTHLENLSRAIRDRKFSSLVESSEEFYHNQIDKVVRNIVNQAPVPKFIIVAGPSASGKTTTTIKIRDKLHSIGVPVFIINGDSYFYDRSLHPKDDRGDYDYETPQALNIKLFCEDISRILTGNEIRIPRYDFKTGRQHLGDESICISKETVVLIDSLHGMYPALTEVMPINQRASVYVETLSQIRTAVNNFVRWSDIRMLRRMVRDTEFRNHDIFQTVLHWRYVRSAELRYIIPRLKGADAIINTYLAYELPVLKARFSTNLGRVREKLDSDPTNNHDGIMRMNRLMSVLDEVPEWSDENAVPRNSLLREFIGNGSYNYE